MTRAYHITIAVARILADRERLAQWIMIPVAVVGILCLPLIMAAL